MNDLASPRVLIRVNARVVWLSDPQENCMHGPTKGPLVLKVYTGDIGQKYSPLFARLQEF